MGRRQQYNVSTGRKPDNDQTSPRKPSSEIKGDGNGAQNDTSPPTVSTGRKSNNDQTSPRKPSSEIKGDGNGARKDASPPTVSTGRKSDKDQTSPRKPSSEIKGDGNGTQKDTSPPAVSTGRKSNNGQTSPRKPSSETKGGGNGARKDTSPPTVSTGRKPDNDQTSPRKPSSEIKGDGNGAQKDTSPPTVSTGRKSDNDQTSPRKPSSEIKGDGNGAQKDTSPPTVSTGRKSDNDQTSPRKPSSEIKGDGNGAQKDTSPPTVSTGRKSDNDQTSPRKPSSEIKGDGNGAQKDTSPPTISTGRKPDKDQTSPRKPSSEIKGDGNGTQKDTRPPAVSTGRKSNNDQTSPRKPSSEIKGGGNGAQKDTSPPTVSTGRKSDNDQTSPRKPSSEIKGGGNGAQKDTSPPTISTGRKPNNDQTSPRKPSSEIKGDGNGARKDTSPSTVEYLLELAGSPGRWNYFAFFLASMAGFPLAFHELSYQFLGYTPDFWCHIVDLRDANWTTEEILDIAIPRKEDGSLEGCIYFDYNFTAAALLGYVAVKDNLDLISGGSNVTVSCPVREFNTTEYPSTVTTEWDLVCERRALYSSTQGAMHGCQIFSSYLVGYLSDTFGRRRLTMVNVPVLLLSGVGAFLSANIWLYIFFKMIFTMFTCDLITFVLALELCTTSQRSYVGNLFALPWALGYMILPIVSYFVRDWRMLQLAITAPNFVLILYYWFLPESPRWFIHQGRYQEALEVLKNAAAVNGHQLPPDEKLITVMKTIRSKVPEKEVVEEGSMIAQPAKTGKKFVQLFTTRKTISLTIIVLFCWYNVSLVYYGVALGATNFDVNMYLFVFLGGLLEVPAILILCPATALMGRKKTLVSLYILCAASILGFFYTGNKYATTTLFLVGKFATTAAYQLFNLFTGELFSTETRSLALGCSAGISGLGAMSAPYVNDLMGEINHTAPFIVFGAMACISAFFVLFLPETAKSDLPDSMADMGDTVSSVQHRRSSACVP